MEGLSKNTKTSFITAGQFGRDLNPGPLEYEAGVLTTGPGRSMCWVTP
jgi:hypothetical protein